MAENESLDVGNRRFKWVVADILRGAPASEIAERLLKKLCGAWNYVCRNGFDVVDVVGQAASGVDVISAVRDTGGSDLAHLINVHSRPMALPGAVLDAANQAAVRQIVDSGIQNAICHDNGLDIFQAARLKREILAITQAAVSSITDSLLGGSRARVRVPALHHIPVSMPAAAVQISVGILGQSLLSVAQREQQQGGSYESGR